MNHRAIAAACCLLLLVPAAWPQGDAVSIDKEPVLRVSAGGPTAFVTALAFSPNGQALYAGGYDKVLHAWTRNAEGKFAPIPSAYRLPMGPGIDGAINSVAISPDGVWLAVAGRGMLQHGGVAGFRQLGIWVPSSRAMSDAMWQDQGTIHVFDTRTGATHALRGHRGPVFSLVFADRAGPPLLVSVARELSGKNFVGAVRLWDVAQAKQTAELTDLPDPAAGRVSWPRVAAWGAKTARVALAWEDGNFRLWDAGRPGGAPVSRPDGGSNNTVAYLPALDRVLTTSTKTNQGFLKLWSLAGPQPAPVLQLPFAKVSRPRALAVFPAQPGGPTNRAAVVVDSVTAKNTVETLLYLVDATTLAVIRPPLRLTEGTLTMPFVTASGDGRYLAVSGYREHAIHVFAVADLLKNVDAPQVLRGAGATVYQTAFMRTGARVGLLLGETPAKQGAAAPAAGLVFDFTRRALAAEAGWQLDAPAANGWEVQVAATEDDRKRPQTQLAVSQNGQAVNTIRLKPGVAYTTHALLPPLPPHNVPLLAVGSVDLGQAMLELYDVRSGEQIRQLTGHVNRILSIAFAADGRLLASAGEDQMVCVWTLTDLDKILRRRAMLRGLVVAERGGKVVLDEINAASMSAPNRQQLAQFKVQEGDVIAGFVEKGALRPLTTMRAFYDSVIVLAPGQPVTLRIGGRGDVPLTTGQGIDEHKPLFSLFITRGARPQDRRWIGWSPVGPYDASDRDGERLLGWHKNTGEAKQPATFALAQEHREANYRQDILRYLVSAGNTGSAVEAWKKDHPDKVREPKMTLWIDEPGTLREEKQGRVVLRQPPAKLFLSIHEPPLGKVDRVSWLVDGQQRGEFTADAGDEREWSAALAKLPWARGEHRIRVTLRTAHPLAQDYVREVLVNYQPARPQVKAMMAPPRVVVDKPEYRLVAEIQPVEGQAAVYRLVQRHNGKEVLAEKPVETREAVKIDRIIKLEPGLNHIRLLARNKDAADEEGESEFLAVEVQFKTPRPLVSLTSVLTTPDAPPLRLDPERAERPVLVDARTVRITGEIEAPDKLTAATWATGDAAAGEKRHVLAGEKLAKFPFVQEVTLPEPGTPVKVRFQAKTANSEEAERFVILQYQPKLPEARFTAPVDGQPVIEGKDMLPLRVEARLLWPADRQPCTVQLLVNDKEQGAPAALDGKALTYTGQAALAPGENWLRLRVKNAWREELTPPVLVSYRQPPKIVALKGPAKSAQPFADVIAQVESPRHLPLTQLRIRDHDLPATALKPEAVEQRGETTLFQMIFKDLPLQPGKNKVELLASNADGWALKPATLEIEVAEAAEPRAEATLLDPQQNLVVEASQFPVTFQVRSKSVIRRVELERGGEKAFLKTDFGDLPRGADGYYTFRTTQNVPLLAGPNTLKVIALNAGGEQHSPAVVVTYRTQPVSVRIEQLLVDDAAIAVANVLPDGTLEYQAPRDRVSLKGLVTWGPQNDQKMAKVSQLRLSVNGFQLPGAVLEPAGGERTRAFRADVQLTRTHGNQINVRLPEFAQEQGSRTQCLVHCAKAAPSVRRQAHLLIVDTGKEQDERRVSQRVLQALQATPVGATRFSLAGFGDGGRLYGPLVGEDVTPEKVYMQLAIIKRALRQRASAGMHHDAVFLYFRGGETIEAQGHFFRTSDSERDPELRYSGIPCDQFRRFFTDNLGAQVVLFDVARDSAGKATADQAKDQVTQWPEDPYVAVVRYAWNGPAAQQTEDARLLTDWTEAAQAGKTLGDVVQRVGGKFLPGAPGKRESLKYQSKLTWFQQVPPALGEFTLGAK